MYFTRLWQKEFEWPEKEMDHVGKNFYIQLILEFKTKKSSTKRPIQYKDKHFPYTGLHTFFLEITICNFYHRNFSRNSYSDLYLNNVRQILMLVILRTKKKIVQSKERYTVKPWKCDVIMRYLLHTSLCTNHVYFPLLILTAVCRIPIAPFLEKNGYRSLNLSKLTLIT